MTVQPMMDDNQVLTSHDIDEIQIIRSIVIDYSLILYLFLHKLLSTFAIVYSQFRELCMTSFKVLLLANVCDKLTSETNLLTVSKTERKLSRNLEEEKNTSGKVQTTSIGVSEKKLGTNQIIPSLKLVEKNLTCRSDPCFGAKIQTNKMFLLQTKLNS